ncbi:MAG: hypothetical protein AB7V14_01930 [Kiritimatiellia bacterium]
MNPRAIASGIAGLCLLAIAAWLVPSPRLRPRPELPEIEPFAAGERVALVVPEPENFPAPDGFGLVQRARAAGAEVRIFVPGESLEAFAPTRIYQPYPWPYVPAGYHPDQWPALPPAEKGSGNDWRMLVLSPEEQAAQNAAVLAAARALRARGADDPQGTREAALLSRARRAEIYLPIEP